MEHQKEFEEILDKIMSIGNPNRDIALSAMQSAYNLGQQSKWIDVKDRLPESEGNYILMTNKGVKPGWYYIGKYTGFHFEYGIENITHWQPLPEIPSF